MCGGSSLCAAVTYFVFKMKPKAKPKAKPTEAPKRKATAKPKNTGRPPLKIDEGLVEFLASIQCTMIEIASGARCSVDTLERRYADVIKNARETGKASLRRMQWKSCKDGNVTMQIWLGKQWLGQRDQRELSAQVSDEVLLKYIATVQSAMSGEI
jgi:hypothetical protein